MKVVNILLIVYLKFKYVLANSERLALEDLLIELQKGCLTVWSCGLRLYVAKFQSCNLSV